MVQERLNQEIAKQRKLGKTNLPPLVPPGSLDGMEMFGFSSPAIIQVSLSKLYCSFLKRIYPRHILECPLVSVSLNS